jgi:P2 family phage contractile tail tube protein
MPNINRLINGNLYVDGKNFLGKCEEATLPDIKVKMTEHKGLGMVGTLELPAGLDKLEAKFKMSSLYPEIVPYAGNPYRKVKIQVRSNLEVWVGGELDSQLPVVAHLEGRFTNFPLGGYKSKDNAEFELNMSVTAAKLVVDGQELYEVDVMNNIHKVNGEDVLAEYRSNIGG